MPDQHPRHAAPVDFAPRAAAILFAILQILTPLLPLVGVGEPVGERSDGVRTLITPAGWAFAIWGPLYLSTILFAIYQALPSQRDNALLVPVRWPAAIAFACNALWVAYTQVFGLSAISTVIILVGLVSMMTIYLRFADWRPGFSVGDRWLAALPLCALAAWLTVATIVNVAASLRFHGIDPGSAAPTAAAGVIVVTGIIGASAVIRGRGNPAYTLVLLWALAAIHAAGGQRAGAVAAATAVAALLVVGGAIIGFRRDGVAHWFGQGRIVV